MKERLIQYLGNQLYFLEDQVLDIEEDPEPETLWMVARAMGIEDEVQLVIKGHWVSDFAEVP